MSKKYKVWVEIEEIDEEAGTYEDVGEATYLRVFDNLEDAELFVISVEQDATMNLS